MNTPVDANDAIAEATNYFHSISSISVPLATSGIAYIFFTVFLTALRESQDYSAGIFEKCKELGSDTKNIFVIAPYMLFVGLHAFASHAIANWKYYFLCGLVITGAKVTAAYHSEMLEGFDMISTKYTLPFYNDVILPTLNVMRLLFDIFICWFDMLVQLYRLYGIETLKLLAHCESANYQNQVNKAVTLIETPYNSMVNFIISKGKDEFEYEAIVSALTNFTLTFQPLADCMCHDLSFTTEMVLTSVALDDLGRAIDKLLNAITVDMPRVIIKFLADLIDSGGVYECDTLECKITRPPDFSLTTQHICESSFYSGLWIDEVLQIIFDTFFDPLTDFNLPPLANLLSPLPCAIAQVLKLVADALFHVDLVFDGTNYFKYMDFVPPQNTLLNISVGFDDFFQAFGNDFTDEVGASLSGTTETVIRVYNFSILVTQIFITDVTFQDGTNPQLVDFINTYDYQPMRVSWDKAIRALTDLASKAQEQLGQAIYNLLKAIDQLAFVLWRILINLLEDIMSYILGPFESELNIFYSYWLNFIGYSTDIIKFISPNPDNCYYPAYDDRSTGQTPQYRPFFCCVGAFIKSVDFMVVDFTQGLIHIVITFAKTGASVGSLIDQMVTDMDTKIVVDFDNIIKTMSGMATSPFPQTCSATPSATYQNRLADVSVSFLNVTSGPMRLVVVLMKVAQKLKNNPHPTNSQISDIVCIIIKGFYDVSIGAFFNICSKLALLTDCFVGNGASSFGEGLWELFGWDSNYSANFRVVLCVVTNALLDFITGLVNMFNGLIANIFDMLDWIECSFNQLKRMNGIFAGDQVFCAKIRIDFEHFSADFSYYHGKDKSTGPCEGNYHIKIPNLFMNIGSVPSTISSIFTNIFGFQAGGCSPPFTAKLDSNSMRSYAQSAIISTDDIVTAIASTNYTITPDSICYSLMMMLNDSSTSQWEKNYVDSELAKCIFAEMGSVIVNAGIGYPIFDKDAFYDVRALMNSTRRFIDLITPVVYYSSIYSDGLTNDTWAEFVVHYNVTNPFTISAGGQYLPLISNIYSFFGGLFNTANNLFMGSNQLTPTQFLDSMDVIYQAVNTYGWDVWMEEGGLLDMLINPGGLNTTSVSSSASMALDYSRQNNKQQQQQQYSGLQGEHLMITSGSGVTTNVTQFQNFIATQINATKAWWSVFSTAKTERVKRNRRAMFDISDILSHKFKDGKERAALKTHIKAGKAELLTAMESNGANNTIDMNDVLILHDGDGKPWRNVTAGQLLYSKSNQLLRPMVSYTNTIGEICVPNTDACVNCTLLKNIIDDIVTMVCKCIAESQQGVSITEAYNHGKQKNIPLSKPHLFNGGADSTLMDETDKGFNLNTAALYLYDKVLGTDLVTFATGLGSFFTNTNTSDTNSVYFWLFAGMTCDWETQLDCTEGASGFGLTYAIYYVIPFYCILTAITILIFTPTTQFTLYLWLSVPVTIMASAYLYSPMCFPAVPMCVADDIYHIFQNYGVECIGWGTIIPGMTSEVCPGKSQDYTRAFVECQKSPFYFKDGFRNVFYLIEKFQPSVNTYLRTTESAALSWIRDVLRQQISFPFPPGETTKQFDSCNNITMMNMAAVILWLILAATIAALFLMVLASFLSAVFRALTTLITVAILGLKTVYHSPLAERSKFYTDVGEIFGGSSKQTAQAFGAAKMENNQNGGSANNNIKQKNTTSYYKELSDEEQQQLSDDDGYVLGSIYPNADLVARRPKEYDATS
jgi:hypothetical protein